MRFSAKKMPKSALRQELIARRNALTPAEHVEKSAQIRVHLKSLPEFLAAKRVLFFAAKEKEVDLLPLIEEVLSTKEVFLPCAEKGGALKIRKITGLDDLKKGAFGILEPCTEKCAIVDPATLDLVLVPATGVDRAGQRLGFGGGFYDRFLAQRSIFTVAVVFACQMVDKIPTEIHDVSMKAVLNEDGILRF